MINKASVYYVFNENLCIALEQVLVVYTALCSNP